MGAALVLGATACSGDTATSSSSDLPAPDCPTTAIPITVSVNQWGNIVEQLAGKCGTVSTVIASATGDPHDYEPGTGDIAKFTNAQMVVVNGMGYDEWASKAIDANNPDVDVVSAAKVNNVADGANPHLWYNPTYVTATANAITAQLKSLVPAADSYFDQQQTDFNTAMEPYFAEISKINTGASGKTYGATEGVFDYMAAACGLTDLTPKGYQNATENESDPAPGDITAFDKDLTAKKMDVLIYNTQTEGSIPNQLKATAESADVPVVNVTETMPAEATTFQQWQVSQLQELSQALGLS